MNIGRSSMTRDTMTRAHDARASTSPEFLR
jgi:hypothetical protein